MKNIINYRLTITALSATFLATACQKSGDFNQSVVTPNRTIEVSRDVKEPKLTQLKDTVDSELVYGEVGASSKWKSGWLDLDSPTDFSKGDQLRIRVGGTATKVLIRMLPNGRSPDTPTGLRPDIFEVPDDRRLTVTLRHNRSGIIQISAHGGDEAFGKRIGTGNGPVTIEEVEIVYK